MSREAHVRICESARVKFPRATRPLAVEIDLGSGLMTRQKLRLRGIDTPELNTKAGQRAKQFVQSQLKAGGQITIKSSKSDKYDRYLADVVYQSSGRFRERVSFPRKRESVNLDPRFHGDDSWSAGMIYLNQLLLDKGFAVRY
jgi:endonuclease YncB( thermonuclease family)